MPIPGEIIRASIDGSSFRCEFVSEDYGDPAGKRRWTVKASNGVLAYVYPDAPDTDIIVGPTTEVVALPMALEATATAEGEAPPEGERTSDDGVRMGHEDPVVQVPSSASIQEAVWPKRMPKVEGPVLEPEPELELEARFAIKREGRKMATRSYHLYGDCGHVPADGDVERIPVTDDMIRLFDLDVCSFCEKRRNRMTNVEGLLLSLRTAGVEVTEDTAQLVVKELDAKGFRLSPDWVAQSS